MAARLANLLSVAFLQLLALAAFTAGGPGPAVPMVPIRLSVEAELLGEAPQSYAVSAVEGGVLLGALRRLQDTDPHFKFTVTEHPDFGVLLESVNGVAGSEDKQTYWELLTEAWGRETRLDVGIGCYKPKANEHVILRLSTSKR